MSDSEFVSAIESDYNDSNTTIYFTKFRSEYIQNYAFFDGEQWDEEDVKALSDEQKAYVVFNRVAINIDALTGYSIINPQDILPIPIDIGDIVVDEILEGAIRFIRRKGGALNAEAMVLMNLLIGGIGVLNIYLDYSYGQPKIMFESVNPLEMTWDISADKPNLENCGWMCRERLYSANNVEYMWPGKIKKYGLTEVSYRVFEQTGVQQVLNFAGQGQYGSTTGAISELGLTTTGIPIKEYQWWETSDVYTLTNPSNGEILVMGRERYDKVKDELGLDKFPKTKDKRRMYYKAFLSGSNILEKGENTSAKRFTYQVATGKRRLSDGIWYGAMSQWKDPQKWANKFFSSILDIIAANTKGGAFIETGALEDPREAENQWAKSSPLIRLKRGGVNRIRDRSPHPYPSGIERMMTFAIEAIREVSGVNVEILGLADRRQAGVVESSRKQSALAIVAKYVAAMTKLREEEGYLIIEFMRTYMMPDQLIKIDSANINRFDTVEAIFNNDIEYEMLVDEAPTSVNYKEKAWAGIAQVLPILLRTGVPIPPELTDYAPIPTSLSQKWKQLIIQRQQQEEQMRALQAQLAGAAGQAPGGQPGQPAQGRDINNLITSNQSELQGGLEGLLS